MNWLEEQNRLDKDSLKAFRNKFPQYTECWGREVETFFKFDHFIGGFAVVTRNCDNQKGFLSFTDQFGLRIYFNFREKK